MVALSAVECAAGWSSASADWNTGSSSGSGTSA